MTRICTKCGEEKSVALFGRQSHRQCLKCLAKRQLDYYYRNHEACRANNRRSREKKHAHIMWSKAKDRAEKSSLPFDLTVEYVQMLLDTTPACPILGVPLVMGKGKDPNGASLDRIIPELGYVQGNVAVISTRANWLKSNATMEELQAILNWMADQIDGPKPDITTEETEMELL